ncbi:hypothetical protein NLJ89_g11902 [Agrocybe chaxingu]|uniref:Uncharacterized protein n=1 Tax=Agrocybe chaxingu TaxID=84603 RepID=A0A9W8JL25_9AGAR|nr:hypothetical protein NLJ89_g11902 [Agrocybe chaxingu]
MSTPDTTSKPCSITFSSTSRTGSGQSSNLQPPTSFELPTPYTFKSTFYINPYAPLPEGEAGKKKAKPRGRAPDRIVIRQMKIFKEQWMGMGISLSLGRVKSDQEPAAAIWRNLLGARGAGGIALPSKIFFRSEFCRGDEWILPTSCRSGW